MNETSHRNEWILFVISEGGVYVIIRGIMLNNVRVYLM